MSTNSVSSAASKSQATTAAIEAAGQLIASGITAASTIKDQKLRRQFEEQMAQLNAEEQKKLSIKVLSAQGDDAKRKQIAEAIVELAKERISQLHKTNYIPYIVGGVVVLIVGYFMFKK